MSLPGQDGTASGGVRIPSRRPANIPFFSRPLHKKTDTKLFRNGSGAVKVRKTTLIFNPVPRHPEKPA